MLRAGDAAQLAEYLPRHAILQDCGRKQTEARCLSGWLLWCGEDLAVGIGQGWLEPG